MAISLCASFFPLLSSLQDLERKCSNGFSIDSTIKQKNPSSLLRPFLLHREDDYSKLGCDNESHGFKFIEGAYVALKWSKEEGKLLSLDILSGLMKAFLHFARASVKSLEENPTSELRKQSQNNLRVCISYLCHGISITEGNIHNALEQSPEGKRLAANIDGVRWLELKTAVLLLLWKILQSLVPAFDDHKDVKVAGSLIRTAATACLVHQKWGDRAGPSKVCLPNLKRALMGILWDPFLHPLSFAPEVTQQTFSLLITLCTEHKHLITFLVDMIAELISLHQSTGLAFLVKFQS